MTMNPVIPDPTLSITADPGVLQSIGGIPLLDDVREFASAQNLWHSLAATVELARSCYPMIEAISLSLSHDPDDGATAIAYVFASKAMWSGRWKQVGNSEGCGRSEFRLRSGP
jgi:hypothetical protein